MAIPKSMSTVRGCDAPKYDTRVCTRTKTGDRIPGMPKIKGPKLKRGKIYSSNHDPKIKIAHKEHTTKKTKSKCKQAKREDM